MPLKEMLEIIEAYDRIAAYQRKVIRAFANIIKPDTPNAKLSPIVILALEGAISEDNHKDDPYLHVHGIC